MINVIAYYPGGGGHRYMRYINGLEYSQQNITYDNQVTGQKFNNRYLLNSAVVTGDIILTHCLNQTHIKSLINNCKIIFLKSDIKKSLHREWKLLGHARYRPDYTGFNLKLEHYNAVKDPAWPEITNEQEFQSLPEHIKNEVQSMYQILDDFVLSNNEYQQLLTAFSTIAWHDDYYKKYPFENTDSFVVDVDHSDCEFAQTMRRELSLEIDPMFELAWNSYFEFGNDAELTQIYEQHQK